MFENIRDLKFTYEAVPIYADFILNGDHAFAPNLNQAITERWSRSALLRIKKKAWKAVGEIRQEKYKKEA